MVDVVGLRFVTEGEKEAIASLRLYQAGIRQLTDLQDKHVAAMNRALREEAAAQNQADTARQRALQSYQQLMGSMNPATAASQRLAAAQNVVRTAFQEGVISAQKMTAALAQLQVQYKAEQAQRFADAQRKVSDALIHGDATVKRINTDYQLLSERQRQGALTANQHRDAQLALARQLAINNGYLTASGALNTAKALAELRAAQATRDATAAARAQAAADAAAAATKQRLTQSYQQLLASMNPSLARMQQMRQTSEMLRAAVAAGSITMAQAVQALNQYRAALRAAQTQQQQLSLGMNRLGVLFQQAGYQVGDFFVQVQGGTNIMVALGQQLTQLVGVFAMLSRTTRTIAIFSALGVAVPILTAIGAGMIRSGKSTEFFADLVENRLGSLEPVFRGIGAAARAVADAFSALGAIAGPHLDRILVASTLLAGFFLGKMLIATSAVQTAYVAVGVAAINARAAIMGFYAAGGVAAVASGTLTAALNFLRVAFMRVALPIAAVVIAVEGVMFALKFFKRDAKDSIEGAAKSAKKLKDALEDIGAEFDKIADLDTIDLGRLLSAPAMQATREYSVLLSKMREVAREQRDASLSAIINDIIPAKAIAKAEAAVEDMKAQIQDLGGPQAPPEMLAQQQAMEQKLQDERRIREIIKGISGETREDAARNLALATAQLHAEGLLNDTLRNRLVSFGDLIGVSTVVKKLIEDTNTEAQKGNDEAAAANAAYHAGRMALEDAYYKMLGQAERDRLAAGEAYYAGMLALQAGHTAVIKGDEAARLAAGEAYYAGMLALQAGHIAVIKEDEAARLAAGEAYYAGMLALQAGHTAVIKEDEAARLAYLLQQYTLYAKTRSESDALTLTHADRLAKLQQELALQLAINQYGADSVEVAAMQRAAHEATLRAQENVTEEIIRAEMALYDAKNAANGVADASGGITSQLNGAVSAALRLRDAMAAAGRASLSRQDEASVLRAQISAAERGLSVPGAKAATETALELARSGATFDQIAAGSERARAEAATNEDLSRQLSALTSPAGAADGGGDGGGSAQELATLTSITDAMLLRIERERELMGLQGIARRERELTLEIEEQLRQSGQMATEEAIQNAAREIAAREAVNETIRRQQSEMERIGKLLESSMTDAFMSIVDGTKSAEDAFKDMARLIIAELYKVLVVQQLVGQFKSGGGGILGALAGGLGGGGGGGTGALGLPMPFANGGAFMGGNVVPFARGGVVGSPTMFPMAGGRTGLMGEAGPEAIMPLKRGKDGKLGVASEGGGNVSIVQHFNVSANGDESVKRIVAQQVPAIAEATKAAVMDARQRGGKMRATFR
jgi:hypothetical protein